MYQKIVTVRNESGLHARPASVFTAEAKRFQSAVTIRRAGGEAASMPNPWSSFWRWASVRDSPWS